MNPIIRHIFPRIIITISLLGSSLNSFTQEEYIVECITTLSYDGNRRFQDIKLLYPIDYIIDITNTFKWSGYTLKNLSNSESSTTYSIISKDSYIGLQFDYRDFQALSNVNPDLLYYKVTSPGSYTGRSHYDEIWIPVKTHSGTIRFDVNAFDVPRITSVGYPSCKVGCSGSSICIVSSSDNIRFNLSAANPGNANLRIYAYSGSKVLGQYNAGTYNTATNYIDVPFSALNLQYHYGEEVKFDIMSSLGGQTAFNYSYSPTYIFSQMIPAPTEISMTRTACLDEIVLTMPVDIAANHSNYRFVWVGTRDIQLTSYYTGGNNIYLRSNSTNFPTGAASIAIQIADKENLNCARNITVTAIEKPQKPVFEIIPVVKATIGTKNYHLTRYDLTDGAIDLKISNITKTDNAITAYVKSTGTAYQSVVLDGISTAPYPEARKNAWNFKNLGGNTIYTFYLRDGDGCVTSTKSDTLNKPDPVRILSAINSKKVTCHVLNPESEPGKLRDGEIYMTYAGGIPPYDVYYYGNNRAPKTFSTNPTLYSIPAGEHPIKVVDKYGVSASIDVQVLSNDPLFPAMIDDPIDCYGDTRDISMNVHGNNKPTINYTLFNIDGSIKESQQTNIFYSIPAGTYILQIESDGCINRDSLFYTQPNEIEITAIGSKIARYGDKTGTIDLTIKEGIAGYDYILSDSLSIIKTGATYDKVFFKGLAAGKYKVEVTDNNSCPKSLQNILVRQPNAPLSITSNTINVDCYGNSTGKVYPVAKGGWKPYQFVYNGISYGAVTHIDNLPVTGTLPDNLTVIDSAGISANTDVVITQPAQLITSIASVSNLNCYNDHSGSVKLNISGGTPQYLVSADNSNWTIGDLLSGLSAGSNQTIFVRDANNCPSTESVSITQPDLLVATKDSIIDALCQQNTGAIQTTISGGTKEYSFNWYYADSSKYMGVNSGKLEDIYSGQYFLFVMDKNRCKDSLMVSVSDINGPKLTDYSIDSVSCFGGKDGIIHITDVSGGFPGYKYFIDGIETTPVISGLSNKSYHFRLTDTEGCKIDKYFSVPQPKAIEISAQTTNPVCYNSFDGSITTRVTGGNGLYSYLWSNNTKTANLVNLNKGNLKLTITDRKGCKLDKSFDITPPAAPTANLKQNPSILCTGNTLQLDGGDFVSYRWNKNNSQVSTNRYLTLSEAGTYTLKISNELGCIGIDTFNLKVSDHPLDAVLLVQDSAIIDEVIKVVDVTWPVPDSIQWYFDKPISLDDNNSWMQKFHTDKNGIVNVTLRAWYGGCFSDSSKTVTIYYEDGFIPEKNASILPLILGFKAYPNPNEGNFKIAVKLSREADITLKLYNSYTSKLEDVQNYFGLEEYEIPYNLTGLNSGVYIIELSSEKERQVLKVVID